MAAEAPAAAEAHAPAYAPAQARDLAATYAERVAPTEAWPPIAKAAHALDPDALRRELAAGVDVDQREPGGRTPLQLVCMFHNQRVVYVRGGTQDAFVDWAASPPSRRSEIDKAINADRLACISLLLERGASLNPGGDDSPLLAAASQGSVDAVNMLIAAGSNPNMSWAPDRNNSHHTYSPLFLVVLLNRPAGPAIVDALLRAGADANPPEYIGRTLMASAIGYNDGGNRRLWPVLLRGGARLPPRELNWASYNIQRAHPYLLKVEAAGGWKAYEKAHRAALQAIFAPKFTHLVPPELVARIVEFSFHLGFY